jgi:Uncharacterized protein conserved in bacteria
VSALVADTHALIWYLDPPGNLSASALAAMRAASASGDLIYVSAITIIEIVYLVEKGRVPATALAALKSALRDPFAAVSVLPVDFEVADAVERIARSAVPDMPDRIIAATALHLRLPLVTKDAAIRSAGITTVW